jgi:hypothetical protein
MTEMKNSTSLRMLILQLVFFSLMVSGQSQEPFTRSVTTPWHWLSFPRLQRTANNPVVAIPVLENIDPIPENLQFNSNESGILAYIIRQNGLWLQPQFNEITSTKGYKLNILDEGSFTHTMYGSDLNPNTPVLLYVSQNDNPENWIGYFLHQSLMPQEAFQGVWEYLTEIKTQYWTMVKVMLNGRPVWLSPSNVTPIKFGDAVVVKVSEDCTLYWNQSGEPAEESQRVAPEYFDYIEYADYQPWFIQTDSLGDVKEIGLMAGEVCIGASTVKTGDTLVGVSAYAQAVPPGTPVTIATWDGLKTTATITDKYFVIRPETGRKEYRTVHTGEGQPYYYISFTGQQQAFQQNIAQPAYLTGISPNPCREAAFIRFNILKDADVAIEISDINGRRISTVAKGEYPEGSFEVVWKTSDDQGNPVEIGIYIVSLIVGDRFIENQKVVVIR